MGQDNTINITFFSHAGADDLFTIDRSRAYSFKPTGGVVKVLTESMALAAPVADIEAVTAAEVDTHGVVWPQDLPYSNTDAADRAQYHERCFFRVPTGTTLVGDRQIN